jgi:pimeloyl-ACP methyl ester carboxylesterase
MAHTRSAAILTICLGLTSVFYYVRKWRRAIRTEKLNRAEDELHPLLKDHTSFHSYTTDYATYSSIRTFYRPHAHVQKQPELSELPLLVFIHGLGGVLPQFAPILGSLTNIAPCFGLELPGHGRSTFDPKEYKAYTTEAFVALWRTAIEETCIQNNHKKVVLVGQ